MRMISAVRWMLFGLVLLSMSAAAFGQIGIAINIAPPALPVYEQPLCPEDGYIWTPGYWAYDYDAGDYYWVPGTWIMAPEVGYLWTPPYWGWNGGGFVFYDGYWGPQVGFYGGIDYGFGYFGEGFEGGRWDNGHFFYNRSVSNVNVTVVRNVYNTTVVNRTVNRVSYNGGNGGINARPTPQQEAAARERHIPPVAAQNQHLQAARSNRELRASANQGKPPIAATPRPGDFKDRGVVQAREAGAPYNARANNAGNRSENSAPRTGSNNVFHPKELPPAERPAAPNTGNPKRDQKYQQQQDKLINKQNQEREKLQQQQEKDHQKLAKQQADEPRKQQVEQRHQQQTQQLQQRHTEQVQHLQQRQQPPANRNAARPPKGKQ